jgi:flagellar FliJ protein
MQLETLNLLIDRAREQTEAARLRVSNLQRLVEKARIQLETLREYAHEYDTRAAGLPGQLRDPSAQQNQLHFIARLQQAVDTQVRELEIRQASVAEAEAFLAQCRRKQQSLETLRQRRLESLRLAQARRDQKETDEFARRAHEQRTKAEPMHEERDTGEAQ